MAIQTLRNERSTSKVVKKVESWFSKKTTTVTLPTLAGGKSGGECKAKIQAPQRMVSTSSVETITSQEDDTDTDGEEAVGDDDIMLTNQRSVCSTKINNETEQTNTDVCHSYEILLWFGCSLGCVGFTACAAAGYPCVNMTDGNESLPGMWNIKEGDFLVAINECSTHSSSMSYESVMQIVATGARPAVLHFRRPTPEELQHIPTRKRKPTSEERLGRRRNRERLEKTLSYVIWREGDGPLGVSLKKQRDSLYPVVADMNRSSVVRSHASIGDQLISINQHEICKLGSKSWVQILKSAPKPLVLTFRRLGSPVNKRETRTLDL